MYNDELFKARIGKIIEGKIIKNIRNLLKLEKENEIIKDRIIRD